MEMSTTDVLFDGVQPTELWKKGSTNTAADGETKKEIRCVTFFSTIMFFLYLFFYNFVGGYNSDGIWQGSPKIEGQYEVKKQLKVSDRFIEKTLEMAKSYR